MPTEFTVGRSITISAVITPDDATDKSVTFTSSNPEVATVEYIQSEYNYSLALLKAVGPGKATITATANDGSGVKAEAEVDVLLATKMVSDISITMSKSEVKVGYMVRATATVSPEDATNREITWSSSNTAIARVRAVEGANNKVDVIGVSPGSVIITATAKDGSGVTASVPVTVIDGVAVTGVDLDKKMVEIYVGTTETVKAQVKPADAKNKNVTWTIGNPEIATVNDGVVTGVAEGETTLTVTTVDGGFTASIPVKVIDPSPSVTFKTDYETDLNVSVIPCKITTVEGVKIQSGYPNTSGNLGYTHYGYDLISNPVKLTFDGNPTDLTLYWCGITEIDLSKLTALEQIDLSRNKLTKVDFSHNKNLRVIKLCNYYEPGCNDLTSEAMHDVVESLPDRTGKEAGQFIIWYTVEGSECPILPADVANAQNKNWVVY